MKISTLVATVCKKLSAIVSYIFSANNNEVLFEKKVSQTKNNIAGKYAQCCDNTLPHTITNNISDGAEQSDASFLFMPVTVCYSGATSAKKGSHNQSVAKTYTLSEADNITTCKLQTGLPIAEPNKNSFMKKIVHGVENHSTNVTNSVAYFLKKLFKENVSFKIKILGNCN